jgi:hypothetical protein
MRKGRDQILGFKALQILVPQLRMVYNFTDEDFISTLSSLSLNFRKAEF